jgi:hypothetical protein
LLEPARIFSAGNSGLSNSGKSFSRCAPRDISGTRKTWPWSAPESYLLSGGVLLRYGASGVDRWSESSSDVEQLIKQSVRRDKLLTDQKRCFAFDKLSYAGAVVLEPDVVRREVKSKTTGETLCHYRNGLY